MAVEKSRSGAVAPGELEGNAFESMPQSNSLEVGRRDAVEESARYVSILDVGVATETDLAVCDYQRAVP